MYCYYMEEALQDQLSVFKDIFLSILKNIYLCMIWIGITIQ